MLRLTVLITALLVAGCSAPIGSPPSEESLVMMFGGQSNLDLVKSANKVEVCRLNKNDPDSDEYNLTDYSEGPFDSVSEAQAKRFREIFESPQSYLFAVGAGCMPQYNVRVRFSSEEDAVDVSLCLECMALAVRRDGKTVGVGLFNPAETKLIALCQELFPDDPEIQKLGR